MIVASFDPSLTAFGWAILDSKLKTKTKLVDIGVIKSKQKGWERIDEIMGVIKEKALQCTEIALEGYAFMAQGSSIFQLAELSGIVKYHFWCVQMPIEIYPPSVWRKVICGKGNIAKADEGLAIYKQWGLEGELNSLEAWAVGRTHVMRMCEREKATKAQEEVFKRIDKTPAGLVG